MVFKRIDRYTVQCIISHQELENLGMSDEDLFRDREKTDALLHRIIEQASEEVNYQPESGQIAMQVLRMPDGGFNIFLTDHARAQQISNFLEFLKQTMSGQVPEQNEGRYPDSSDNADSNDSYDEEGINKIVKAYRSYQKEQDDARRKELEKEISRPKLFRFESLDSITEFARNYMSEKSVSSSIYKDTESNVYYLLVKKGKLKVDNYLYLCNELDEFSAFISQEYYAEQYCKEHFKCLIKKNAFDVLKEYDL
ncbi:MAG: adaptor protein MecA [Lachnospiraceae bacterium]|nr:adaptor protein MecA [Lachnospiraceae bacterium]MEE3461087.1 adaptor protein MecA [Lachnospiraceae bacterium]